MTIARTDPPYVRTRYVSSATNYKKSEQSSVQILASSEKKEAGIRSKAERTK